MRHRLVFIDECNETRMQHSARNKHAMPIIEHIFESFARQTDYVGLFHSCCYVGKSFRSNGATGQIQNWKTEKKRWHVEISIFQNLSPNLLLPIPRASLFFLSFFVDERKSESLISWKSNVNHVGGRWNRESDQKWRWIVSTSEKLEQWVIQVTV